jgi:hypothetical protein
MNLFKQVKNKKTYLNNRSWIPFNMEDVMFCASCERPFKVRDYNVKLKLNKKVEFDEIITCPNSNCEGDMDYWITPDSALDILMEVYEKEKDEMTIPEKIYYNSLINIMNNISKESDCSKIEILLDGFKNM